MASLDGVAVVTGAAQGIGRAIAEGLAAVGALAKELGRDNVLVNCVAPGFTMSTGVQEHPGAVEALRNVSLSVRTLQRDQVPEDVVGAFVYLCAPGSDFVTGRTIVIDGGQTFH